MLPEILLTPRFYPSYIQTLKILVKFCCSRTFSNLILLPFRGSRIYRIHILILLKGSRIFLKSGYSLGNIPILLDYSLESARTGGVNPEKYITSIGVCLCVSITYQWLVCQYQDQRRTPGLCQYFPAPTTVFQCQSLIIKTDRWFIQINPWHSTFLTPSYPGLLFYHHHTASVDGHQGRNSRIIKEGGALHKRPVIEHGLL